MKRNKHTHTHTLRKIQALWVNNKWFTIYSWQPRKRNERKYKAEELSEEKIAKNFP